jgi:hypothetical protein
MIGPQRGHLTNQKQVRKVPLTKFDGYWIGGAGSRLMPLAIDWQHAILGNRTTDRTDGIV